MCSGRVWLVMLRATVWFGGTRSTCLRAATDDTLGGSLALVDK